MTDAPERIARIIRENLSGVTSTDPDIRAAQEDDLMRTAKLIAADLCALTPAPQPDTCWRCGGTGLALNYAGEPGLCSTCKGDTVTVPQPEVQVRRISELRAAIVTASDMLSRHRERFLDSDEPDKEDDSLRQIEAHLQGAMIGDDEAAFIPAPPAATPTAQEAVPVARRYRYVDPVSGKPIWRYSNNLWNGQRPSESQPLYAHPPQPSETVAEAINAVLKWENKLVRSDDDLKERNAAFAALRALKGGDANG